MNITSAQYISHEGNNIAVKATVDEETLQVPIDPSNRHYAAILEWVAEGNTIAEAD